jgi:hypothetical protein
MYCVYLPESRIGMRCASSFLKFLCFIRLKFLTKFEWLSKYTLTRCIMSQNSSNIYNFLLPFSNVFSHYASLKSIEYSLVIHWSTSMQHITPLDCTRTYPFNHMYSQLKRIPGSTVLLENWHQDRVKHQYPCSLHFEWFSIWKLSLRIDIFFRIRVLFPCYAFKKEERQFQNAKKIRIRCDDTPEAKF